MDNRFLELLSAVKDKAGTFSAFADAVAGTTEILSDDGAKALAGYVFGALRAAADEWAASEGASEHVPGDGMKSEGAKKSEKN